MIKKVLIFILALSASFGFCHSSDPVKGEFWSISEGKIQPNGSSKDALSLKYWQHITKILPSELLHQYIVGLRLFTDGIANDMGGISPLNNENSQWEIDIDTTDFNFENTHIIHVTSYTHTVIHEFGHLLTLNPKQVEMTNDIFQDDNKGYLANEGYAETKSYLGKFVNQFWKNALLLKWDKIQSVENSQKRINLLYELYLNNRDQFLTDYAAESPEEDIAESWAFFILNEKPTLNKIKHQKILFFYEFPELINYREEIRKNLDYIPVDYINKYEFNREQISSKTHKS